MHVLVELECCSINSIRSAKEATEVIHLGIYNLIAEETRNLNVIRNKRKQRRSLLSICHRIQGQR